MPLYPVGGCEDESHPSIPQINAAQVSEKRPRVPSISRNIRDRVEQYRDDAPRHPGDVSGENAAVASEPFPPLLKRQDSEERGKLEESFLSPGEIRRASADRRRSRGTSITPSVSPHPAWADQLFLNTTVRFENSASSDGQTFSQRDGVDNHGPERVREAARALTPLQIPPLDPSPFFAEGSEEGSEGGDDHREEIDRYALEEEYDRRWILNLSMHFRDKSNREKFFVTYAEKPNMWRRITVSLDYRDPLPGSLEADISTLHYQRDKSMRIFEEIRESLAEIQYYDTVTNLKLETSRDDCQLHVHVREDVNEIIRFPAISSFAHIHCPRFNESALDFDSHLSGFVYKVRLNNRVLIKKEIPGPDTVEEFLYEVNALDSLIGGSNVVQLEGLVTDDHGALVKGLLISYASQGSLVDIIYDLAGSAELPWHRREKWAQQIVTGLSNIHEAGFVQGDFTLSNIVIDDEDDAQIIDINRRGCPVGWEPPELGRLIESGQRIGMCIGTKTDLFQLGMVLWALAEENDEPEKTERPLRPVSDHIPTYFRDMVATCLSPRPQGRASAKELLRLFPESAGKPAACDVPPTEYMPGSKVSSVSTHRSDKEYIDPAMAVTIEDVKDRRRSSGNDSQFTLEQVTYVEPGSNPTSSIYRFESSGSWVIGRRGRSPTSSRRRRSSPFNRTVSSATSFSEMSPTRRSESHAEHPETSDAKLQELRALLSQHRHFDLGAGIPIPNLDLSRVPANAGLPAQLFTRRVTDLQDQPPPTHLLHTDSGFHEMEDMLEDLDLTDSHITEKGEDDHVRESGQAQSEKSAMNKKVAAAPSLSTSSQSTTSTFGNTPKEGSSASQRG